jgi:hypothetical protein
VVAGSQRRPFREHLRGGPLFFPADDASELLRFYRDFADGAPEELTTVVNLRYVSPLPFIPAPKPYLAHQGTFDATVPHGRHYYWRSEYLDALDDAAIDALVDHAWASRSPRSYTIVFQLGGAVGRVPEEATAFSGCTARFAVNVNGVSLQDGYAEQVAWVRRFGQALHPLSAGVYMNFLGDDGQDRVLAAYGRAKYDRLVALKRVWDPDNFFRRNQNIRPSS